MLRGNGDHKNAVEEKFSTCITFTESLTFADISGRKKKCKILIYSLRHISAYTSVSHTSTLCNNVIYFLNRYTHVSDASGKPGQKCSGTASSDGSCQNKKKENKKHVD